MINIQNMIQILSKKCFSDIQEFEIDNTKTIGKGSFGVVRLAIHKGTNRLYAIKIIDLKHIERDYELRLIEREIHLHSLLDHPHIVKLWDTILDKNVVYLVMEYAEEGNLFHHQNSKLKFNEAEAFKFFYQITKAVGYMHTQDTLHRDIKPENILLDKNKNALLADFGWSARGILEDRSTFCGTYEYMAPEMISKQTYNYKVDIWSLGILLYQMLHGSAPFTGETLPEVQKKIERGEYGIHAGLSTEVKSLLKQILQFNPQGRPDVRDILSHEWVKRMEGEINYIVKKEFLKNCASVGDIISKIVTDNERKQSKVKTLHKKTESAINMFGYEASKKTEVDGESSCSEEEKRKIKKNKSYKTMANESIKRMISQRTESPIFSAKENVAMMSKLRETKIVKQRKHQHARLFTEIGEKLKIGSPSNLRTNTKTSQETRDIKKRHRLRDIVG